MVVEVDTNPLAGAGGPWLGIPVGATAAAVRQGSVGGLLPRLNPLADAGSFASASGERSPNEARGGNTGASSPMTEARLSWSLGAICCNLHEQKGREWC